jgi:predicted TPR repeat methyltransferase
VSRLADAYFEQVYAEGDDPWGFETRWYEARKRALTLAALPEHRYRSAYEPGCALGLLSVGLSERCDALRCEDPIAAMVERAHHRLAEEGAARCGATVSQAAIPEAWPSADEATFDLVVLSEVAYYLDAVGLDELEARLADTLEPGGDLVAVHWTGRTDYPSTADEVHDRLGQIGWLEARSALRDAEFRLDVWRRR